MRIAIIEDEMHILHFLKSLIEKSYPYMEIAACLSSIANSVEFLLKNHVDLIFMDIHLEDGYCFKIFERVNLSDTMIIFVTAYDEYALKAFDQNAVAYVLKPLTTSKIEEAIKKYYAITNHHYETQKLNLLLKALKQEAKPNYKERFIIKLNSKMIVVEEKEVAYFTCKEHTVYLYTKKGDYYVINYSLDSVMNELNKDRFYRVSRNCITAIDSIKEIHKYFKGKLKLILSPSYQDGEIIISRENVPSFLKYIDGNIFLKENQVQ